MTIDGTLRAYNQDEKRFYEFVRRSLQPYCFIQRIESATTSGIPDLWLAHRTFSCWVELKMVLSSGVLLRKEQYAWAMKLSAKTPEDVRILALDKKERVINLWTVGYNREFNHIDVEPYGRSKKYVRILNEPHHVCNQDSISFRHMLSVRD